MYFLKACPRCRGDVYLSLDIYGHYYQCLQCGRFVELHCKGDPPETERKGPALVAGAD